MKNLKKIGVILVVCIISVVSFQLVKARTFTSILPVANNISGFTSNDSPAGNSLSYTDNGNGTVTDNVTGMMWQQDGNASGNNTTWANALTYCDNLSLGGYTDWHLPTHKELYSIVSFSSYNPTIDTSYFTNTQNSYYWTSTTCPSNTATAFIVDFYNGYSSNGSKTNSDYSRCVR